MTSHLKDCSGQMQMLDRPRCILIQTHIDGPDRLRLRMGITVGVFLESMGGTIFAYWTDFLAQHCYNC